MPPFRVLHSRATTAGVLYSLRNLREYGGGAFQIDRGGIATYEGMPSPQALPPSSQAFPSALFLFPANPPLPFPPALPPSLQASPPALFSLSTSLPQQPSLSSPLPTSLLPALPSSTSPPLPLPVFPSLYQSTSPLASLPFLLLAFPSLHQPTQRGGPGVGVAAADSYIFGRAGRGRGSGYFKGKADMGYSGGGRSVFYYVFFGLGG
ncbi:hypothetical protein EV426DRAFT_709371 [Tirmania nivea]|nr:hypothetical protein EV426DRAFT_709371 [Tirmania nivea]